MAKNTTPAAAAPAVTAASTVKAPAPVARVVLAVIPVNQAPETCRP